MLASCKMQGAIVFVDNFENNPINNNSGANGAWTADFDASKWTVGGNGAVAGTDQYSFSGLTYLPPHSGHIAAAFFYSVNDGTVSTASLSATSPNVSTTLGTTYNVSFWVSNPVAVSTARQNLFSVSWNGTLLNLADPLVNPNSYSNFSTPNPGAGELPGSAGQYVVTPNTNWFQVYISNLTPGPGATTSLAFSGQNNNWATLVDDVMVAETPEPSTVVMLGVGTLLMGFRRRRQQKA